jgi:hypothetical protein
MLKELDAVGESPVVDPLLRSSVQSVTNRLEKRYTADYTSIYKKNRLLIESLEDAYEGIIDTLTLFKSDEVQAVDQMLEDVVIRYRKSITVDDLILPESIRTTELVEMVENIHTSDPSGLLVKMTVKEWIDSYGYRKPRDADELIFFDKAVEQCRFPGVGFSYNGGRYTVFDGIAECE